MCKRHSFLLDKAGKVYDGMGLTHSHTAIASLHGFKSAQHDGLAAFEWQPPNDWPNADAHDGLTVDREPSGWGMKASHDKAIAAYLKRKFPDVAAWDAPEQIDPSMNGKTVDYGYGPITIVTSGEYTACDSSTVRAYGSSTVTAYGSSTVRARADRVKLLEITGAAVFVSDATVPPTITTGWATPAAKE